jgi:epoxyqueuosine reductase QueG
MDAEWVKQIALEEGVSLAGIADLSDVSERPYPEMDRALVVAVRLSDAIFDSVNLNGTPNHAYFHQYRTTNAFIDQALYKVGLKIQAKGYKVVQIAASQSISKDGNGYQALFSHRAAAIRAGLGWIGKSNALVTKAFGPRVRLGTLFIQAPLEADKPQWDVLCGSCNACVQVCPAYALTGETWAKGKVREDIVDVRACSEHMHSAYQHIGRGVVCGLCIAACPIGTQRNR